MRQRVFHVNVNRGDCKLAGVPFWMQVKSLSQQLGLSHEIIQEKRNIISVPYYLISGLCLESFCLIEQ